MTRLTGLDDYLTRTPREEPMWCPEDDVPADECIDPDAHAALWITVREKARDEAEDFRYEIWHDEHE